MRQILFDVRKSEGGVDEHTMLTAGPNGYARQLAKYISSATTIQMHCLRNYGWSPDLKQIREWQDYFKRERDRYKEGPRVNEDTMRFLDNEYKVAPVRELKPIKAQDMPVALEAKGKLITTTEVVSFIASRFSIPERSIYLNNRKTRIMQARMTCYYVLWMRGRMSLCAIARLLNRDHTTVKHGIARFKEQANEEMRTIADLALQSSWMPEPRREDEGDGPMPDAPQASEAG